MHWFALLVGLALNTLGAGAQNLIANGGFEAGNDLPSGWREGSMPPNTAVPVSIALERGGAKSGNACLRFEKSEQRFFPVALLSQSIGSPGGKSKIKLGMWVKAAKARKATMGVIFLGNEGEGAKEWGAYVGEAKQGDSPADHDWKHYSSVLAIPSGTDEIVISLEMYGPGTVWLDDVSAQFVPADTPLMKVVRDTVGEKEEDPLADVADVPSEELKVGGDKRKTYFLIGAKKDAAEPYKLLVVLPGGDGSAEFNPFLRRVWKNGLPPGYLIAQVVATKWSDEQIEQVVWPTSRMRWPGMKFSTEELVEAVIKDVRTRQKVDESKVFTLSWSSGGPAAYAISLTSGQVKGSFVAMSVFKPDQLPPLVMAKGHAFYIFHSPEDFIPISMAREAEKQLGERGAKVTLAIYPGGHGWTSDPFGNIRKGVEWLEQNSGT